MDRVARGMSQAGRAARGERPRAQGFRERAWGLVRGFFDRLSTYLSGRHTAH